MKLTRRAFLGLGVGAAGVAVVGAGGAYMYRDELLYMDAGELAALLRERFDYLRFDLTDEHWREFGDLYIEHYGVIAHRTMYLVRDQNTDRYDARVEHLESTFLLSTDFFLNNADESKPVRYVRLYHPYVSPCWNPLAMAGAMSENASG